MERKIAFLPGEVSQAVETEYEAVVTTNCEKAAEAIVPKWIYTFWEGQNLRRCE
jgi:hypothetical protein